MLSCETLAEACGRREPRLLICDEATSALDTATERGIMNALTVLASGRTSVFVAHRLVSMVLRPAPWSLPQHAAPLRAFGGERTRLHPNNSQRG